MLTVLGGTGQVGSKIVDILIRQGQTLRLVARSADRLRPFIGKKTDAMAGDALDTEFLVQAFKGSDAVFTLIPPNPGAKKFMSYADKIGESIARALEIARVPHVVNLSSVGADLLERTGPIVGLHRMEQRLNKIGGLNVLHIRAAFFMENLLSYIGLIASKGGISGPLRGDLKFPMIATEDVAAYAAEHLLKRDFTGSLVRYLLGNKDLSMNGAASIIGSKTGKPEVRYMMASYASAEQQMRARGVSPDVSKVYSEMSKAFNEGVIRYPKRSAENTTPTSFEEFCEHVLIPIYREVSRQAA